MEVDYISLQKKYGTPFYLLDEDILLERISNIKRRLPDNATLCFAIKANPFLVTVLKDEDLLFEVCSPGELSICEKNGLNPDKIVFSGVCKTEEDVKRAYNLKVNTITLESKTHCEHLIKTIREEPVHDQKVILRLSNGNQFGMSEEDLYDCIEALRKYDNIKISGIHFFTGTQKKQQKIQEEIKDIECFCTQVNQKKGISLQYIEYGPGLSYDYFSGKEDETHNFNELDLFSELIKNSKWNYVIELGRYVASSCGSYVTKVMDVKRTAKDNFIIIDGGINHINYYGQMMGMKIPGITHLQQNNSGGEIQNYTVAGSLCTTADIVVRQLPLHEVQNGDLLVFKNIGAYSITEGIYLFLSHPFPTVLLNTNGTISVLRKSLEAYTLNTVN